ncbi:MAG TPA: flavin reductase family protein [Longimicrobium sp.]|uniref:flavin reductase family protein n=1 Tax=Longimicrobium sp. TaxID=2029185 RepID=UPI002ED8F1FF
MSRNPIVARVQSRAPEPASEAEAIKDLLREAFARWASGVTVVAVDDGDGVQAMVASAFTPVSLDPPLVLVCLNRHAGILPSIRETGSFAISVLGEEQRGVASRVASGIALDASLLEGGEAPVPRGALASMVCTLEAVHPGGDHEIVVGAVTRVELGTPSAPLIYHARGYSRLAE